MNLMLTLPCKSAVNIVQRLCKLRALFVNILVFIFAFVLLIPSQSTLLPFNLRYVKSDHSFFEFLGNTADLETTNHL